MAVGAFLFLFLFPLLTSLPQSVPTQDEVLVELVREMGDTTHPAGRYPAYQNLLHRRDPKVIPLLVKALPGSDTTGYSYGVSILQRFPTELSHPALIQLLSSDLPLLRVYCVSALMRAGRREFAPKLLTALASPGATERDLILMLSRISHVEDAKVQAHVRGLLLPSASLDLMSAVFRYLHTVRDRDAAVQARALLRSSELGSDSRAIAAAYLCFLGEREHAEELAQALQTSEMSSTHFYRIKQLLEDAPELDERILEVLTGLLDTEMNATSLRYLVELLGRLQRRQAAPSLRRLLAHADEQVGEAALQALAQLPGALQAGTLRHLLQPGNDALRLRAAEILRKMDDPCGLPVVLELAKPGSKYRRDAIRALGDYRLPEAVPVLLDALKDGDSLVRSNAFYGLQTTLRGLFPYHNLDLRSTGYDPHGPPGSRTESVQKIRAWWEAHRRRR